jgi:hypothetical protein
VFLKENDEHLAYVWVESAWSGKAQYAVACGWPEWSGTDDPIHGTGKDMRR